MYALSHFCFLTFLPTLSFSFFLLLILFVFPFSFLFLSMFLFFLVFPFFLPFLVVHCAQLKLFYTACRD